MHGRDKIVAADLLQHIASSSGHHRLEQRFLIGERGQHQADQIGVEAAHVAADLDAAAVGQLHVEHCDLRSGCPNPGNGVGASAGLADDFDRAVGLEQLANALAHELVVVEQEHGDLFGYFVHAPMGPQIEVITKDQGPWNRRELRY